MLWMLRYVSELQSWASFPLCTDRTCLLFKRGSSVTSASHLASTAVADELIIQFFQRSEGNWLSERRYYTLPEGETKSLISSIKVQFLPQGSDDLIELARLHDLGNETALITGSRVYWQSQDAKSGRTQSEGETVFGALGATLYRDRGFATSKPVTAAFQFIDPDTLHLRTEYGKSVFEEELKLIGHRYRTRQTIISRAGEHQMIGQYLEKRIDSLVDAQIQA